MKLKKWLDTLLQKEEVNFVLTNRVPRMLVTRWMGRISKIRNPYLARFLIAVWKMFSDLDLSEARHTSFKSLHDCFVRELKAGARVVDLRPDILCSPSDGIVMASGRIAGQTLIQAKGLDYTLGDLLGAETPPNAWEGGCYVTLRLTASMYHRFHAPHDLQVDAVTHIHGDTWNVNPVALKRVERLYCRNERVVLHTRAQAGATPVLIVAVAAILVAGVRLHCLPRVLNAGYRGPVRIPCRHAARKGEELGWFEHGSTIILLAPKCHQTVPDIGPGHPVRMGQALMQAAPGGTPA